jgi:inner membrane protein
VDNITHTLTGALTAKLIERKAVPGIERKKEERTLFWLLVLCANVPDIDVLLNLLGDPLFSLKHHRGLTHSLLFAPFFALLPAALFYRVTTLKNLKLLWIVSLIGILVHIFFDLITSFGTQLLSPLSDIRYATDWMFIIDPIFTGIIALALTLGRVVSRHKKVFVASGGMFVILYLSAELICHTIAFRRVEGVIRRDGIAASSISALPQPLSIFRWVGLVQLEDGVLQTFFSVLNNDELELKKYENARDDAFGIAESRSDRVALSYLKIFRHPWVQSHMEENRNIVEFRDLQFSIDPFLLSMVGLAERPMPFVLRYELSTEGKVLAVYLNERPVPR